MITYTYPIHVICLDTRCRIEDLTNAIANWNGEKEEREREKERKKERKKETVKGIGVVCTS